MKRLAFACALTLAGCNYNITKVEEDPGDHVSAEALATPDYKTVVTVVLSKQCLGCHSNAGGNQGGTNLEGYTQVRSLLTRINYRALVQMDMPKGGLSGMPLKVLQAWIDSGAPETVVLTGEKPDPSLSKGPATWDKVRDKFFVKKCAACHGDENPEKGLNLKDSKQVRASILKIVDTVKVTRSMPPEPFPAVTPAEQSLLSRWIDIGMPE